MVTIQQYQNAMNKLRGIWAKEEEIKEQSENKIRENHLKYRNMIHALEHKRDLKDAKIEKKTEQELENLNKNKDSLISIRNEYRILMELFLIIDHNLTPLTPFVYEYKSLVNIFYEPIDTIILDKYKRIQVYITHNKKKPKNKFDIILVGDTIFNNKVIKLPNDYGIDAHINNANIKILLKSGSSEKTLQEYFNKNKEKILATYINLFSDIEKKYEKAKSLYKDKNWQKAFLEWQKYYYEEHYSHGTETTEYKEIIKKLKDFS